MGYTWADQHYDDVVKPRMERKERELKAAQERWDGKLPACPICHKLPSLANGLVGSSVTHYSQECGIGKVEAWTYDQAAARWIEVVNEILDRQWEQSIPGDMEI